MNSLNLTLFGMLGGGFTPDAFWLALARFITMTSIWAIAALLAWTVWRQPDKWFDLVLGLACAGCITLLAHALAAELNSPRPFMIGLSPPYLSHGARGGQPSAHASAMTALTAFLLMRPRLYAVGLAVGVLMLATGWSRIYLGVHFPLDIVGGIVLGAVGGTLTALIAGVFMRHPENEALKVSSAPSRTTRH